MKYVRIIVWGMVFLILILSCKVFFLNLELEEKKELYRQAILDKDNYIVYNTDYYNKKITILHKENIELKRSYSNAMELVKHQFE